MGGEKKKEKDIMRSNEHRMIFVGIFMFGIGDLYTVIPRLTKIIRSGITFVSRNLR